jgi:hypothetical protein
MLRVGDRLGQYAHWQCAVLYGTAVSRDTTALNKSGVAWQRFSEGKSYPDLPAMTDCGYWLPFAWDNVGPLLPVSHCARIYLSYRHPTESP